MLSITHYQNANDSDSQSVIVMRTCAGIALACARALSYGQTRAVIVTALSSPSVVRVKVRMRTRLAALAPSLTLSPIKKTGVCDGCGN